MTIEAIATEEGLLNLEDDWHRLTEAGAFANVFMTFDWFRIWNQRFAQEAPGGGRHIKVLVMRRDGIIAGISPLICRTASRYGLAIRKMEFVEGEAAYHDVVLGDEPALQTAMVVDYLAQFEGQWDLVDLRSVRETGNVASSIKAALARTRLSYRILPEQPCPYFALDAPLPVMLRRLSPHTRHSVRNQLNRLRRMSGEGLRIRIIENPQDEPGLLEKLIALESRKRVAGKLVAPFLARYPEVFKSLFSRLGPRGWVYAALMELRELVIAWALILRCGKKLWGYHRAFNPSFSRLSAGTMLDTALIDYGFSHGYEEYDFLYGQEPYKMRWNTGCHERFRLVIWSQRWASQAKSFIYLDLRRATSWLK